MTAPLRTTTAPEPHPFPVICGEHEERADGRWECVRPPEHGDQGHYWVRLEVRP